MFLESNDEKKAIKIFTDRHEPRKVFWDGYEKFKSDMKQNKISVISYYGMGGIGKTSLIKNIILELEKKVESPKYVYYNFENGCEKRDVLVSLRNILVKEYRFDFTLFDEAVYCYDKKIGKKTEYLKTTSVIEKIPVIGDWIPGIEESLDIDNLIKGLKLINVGISTIKHIKRSRNEEVKRINKKSCSELYDDLSFYFAQDMKRILKDANEPLVIFLDTYELLVNEMLSIGDPLSEDDWIRDKKGIIRQIPNTLWVIAGREKLKWEKFEPKWSESLDQHILGTLSITDASQFLETAGISDANLRAELYALTDGTPVYLDLCVDRYEELIKMNKTPEISDFGNNINSMVKRFVRDMDDSRRDMINILSCLGSWDDDAAFAIIREILPSFSITTYERVKGFSFINETDSYYSIHKTISDILIESWDEKYKKKVYQKAMEYYRAKKKSTDISMPEYAYYIRQWIKYAYEYYDDIGFQLCYFDFNDVFEELSENGRFDTLFAIFEPVFENKKYSDKIGYMAFEDYMKALVMAQRYEKALEVSKNEYSKVTDKRIFIYSERFESNLFNSGYVSSAKWYAQSLSLNDKNEEALEVCEELYNRLKDESVKEDFIVLGIKIQLMDILGKLKKYDEIIRYGMETYENRDNIEYCTGEKQEISRQLAYALFENEQYDDALKIFKELSVAEKDTEMEMYDLNGMAACFKELGENEKAAEYLDMAYQLCVKLHGEEHPVTIQFKEAKDSL